MSDPSIQIAVDCDDPHALVRFWATALDMEIEDHSTQIDELLAAGHADASDVVEIDGRRAWAEAAACRRAGGPVPRLLFQKVPESKAVKNRWHLDLHYPPGDRDRHVERLEALGATRLWSASQGPHEWVTMADPEGNEFCVG